MDPNDSDFNISTLEMASVLTWLRAKVWSPEGKDPDRAQCASTEKQYQSPEACWPQPFGPGQQQHGWCGSLFALQRCASPICVLLKTNCCPASLLKAWGASGRCPVLSFLHEWDFTSRKTETCLRKAIA